MARESGAPRSPVGGRRIMARAGFCVAWAPPNKRMHATADTKVLRLRQSCGAARDARRYAAVSP